MLFTPERLKRRIYRHSIELPILWSLLGVGLAFVIGWANLPSPQIAHAAFPAVQALNQSPGSAAPTETATPPLPSCGLDWRVVSSPDPGDGDNVLQGVTALSADDVWAVGFYFVGDLSKTLTMHWDGTQWTHVPSPNVGTMGSFLTRIAVVTTSPEPEKDIWASGYYFAAGGASLSLIMHWDGTQWSITPTPNPGAMGNFFNGISALASNDVWAAGQFYTGSSFGTFIVHWDGTQWTQVPSPSPSPGDNRLRGVVALAANDVWTAGFYYDENGTNAYKTLLEHWNGTQWNVVPSPNVGTDSNLLRGLSAVSASDIWAVGFYVESASGGYRTLTEHWDGTQWSIMPSPPPAPSPKSQVPSQKEHRTKRLETWDLGLETGFGLTYNYLNGVVALSANDVWAAGYYLDSIMSRTLVEHWNGTSWSIVPSPNVGSDTNYLYAITAASPEDIWAVGVWSSSTPWQTLVERYSDPCVTPTPTNTPIRTNTPTRTPSSIATATRTPVITRTPTPALTVTPCAVNFSDVQAADYFYAAVRYLYCRGAISGYSDGTFRPSNNTTRGQLCKIVVLALGWAIYTPTTPSFQDVPSGHPFYAYIETAHYHYVVSGYDDSTFRPNNNVTRGQLCKIVALAAGIGICEGCPPVPIFSDVSLSSPYYGYIRALYERGIISGYSDGTFRPGNPASRGQASKVVYLAIQTEIMNKTGR